MSDRAVAARPAQRKPNVPVSSPQHTPPQHTPPQHTPPQHTPPVADVKENKKSGAKGLITFLLISPFLVLILAGVYQLAGNMFGFPTPDFATMSMSMVGQTPAPTTLAEGGFRPIEETARPTLPEPTLEPGTEDEWVEENPEDGTWQEGENTDGDYVPPDVQWTEPTAVPGVTLPAGDNYMAGEIAPVMQNGTLVGELIINSAQLVDTRNDYDTATQVFLLKYTYKGLDSAQQLVISPSDFMVVDQSGQLGMEYDLPLSAPAQPVAFDQTHMAEAYYRVDNTSSRVTLVYPYGGASQTLIFDVALK